MPLFPRISVLHSDNHPEIGCHRYLRIGKRWKNTNCLAGQLDHAMLEKRTGQPEC